MKHARMWGLGALAAFVFILPIIVGDPSFTSIAVYVLLFTCAAVAWNLFSGFTGYISLGQSAYFGVGAYTLAVLCQRFSIPGGIGPFLLVPLSGLVASLFSAPIGWVILHTRRYAFVVITISILYLFQLLASNLSGLTGGTQGIYFPVVSWGPDVYDLPFYYFALFITLLAIIATWWLRHSKFGLSLFAIRDDEDRASSLGVPTGHCKLFAFVLSAFFIGTVGALMAYYTGIVYPSYAFSVNFDVSVAVMAFLGGVGTVSGPVIGGLLIGQLQQELNLQFSSIAAGLELVLSGIILLLIVLLLPEGIVPSLSKYWQKWQTIYNKKFSDKNTQYALDVPKDAPLLQMLPKPPEETVIKAVFMKEPSKQVALNIPRQLAQPAEASFIENGGQRLRTPRLVPGSQTGTMTSKMHNIAPSAISWRCPYCQRPFLLGGNTCYCPRCGYSRPLNSK